MIMIPFALVLIVIAVSWSPKTVELNMITYPLKMWNQSLVMIATCLVASICKLKL